MHFTYRLLQKKYKFLLGHGYKFYFSKVNKKIRKWLRKTIFNWIFVTSINSAKKFATTGKFETFDTLRIAVRFLHWPLFFCAQRQTIPLNFESHTPHESTFTKLRNAEKVCRLFCLVMCLRLI